MRHATLKDYEKSLSGGEPSWTSSQKSLAAALNWYSYHSDSKESKKFALAYLKELKEPQATLNKLEKVDERDFENLGFVCRMKLRGAPLSEINNIWIVNFFERLKEKIVEKKVESVPAQVINIQERTANKAREYIGEIEGMLDEGVQENWYTWFQSNGVKAAHTKTIVNFFTKRISEIELVIEGKDKQLVEGYSNYSKKELKDYLKNLMLIVSDCDKLSDNAKITRAPRKTKAKPVEKVVAKLQYKKDDNALKIVSINPCDIIGSSQLWAFNTKTRKLLKIVATDSDGLSVKGTTITGFDEVASEQKTIRQPETVLPNVLKAGKVALKKLFPDIRAVAQSITGRINDDIILLRVIK